MLLWDLKVKMVSEIELLAFTSTSLETRKICFGKDDELAKTVTLETFEDAYRLVVERAGEKFDSLRHYSIPIYDVERVISELERRAFKKA